MKPEGMFERFVVYRFDYASLVVDSIRAFFSTDYRTTARLFALPIFIFLIAPAVVTVWVGKRPFGSEALFAVILLLWPWILEAPAGLIRQLQVEPSWRLAGSRGYDWFMHVVLGVVAFAAIALLAFEPIPLDEHDLAVIWAIGLAGGTDMARSVIALFLAELRGFPLYGDKSRTPP